MKMARIFDIFWKLVQIFEKLRAVLDVAWIKSLSKGIILAHPPHTSKKHIFATKAKLSDAFGAWRRDEPSVSCDGTRIHLTVGGEPGSSLA